MRRVVDFEAHSHILVHHSILVNLLDLLSRALFLNQTSEIDNPQKALSRLNPVTVLWVREKYSNMLLNHLDCVRLHQSAVRVMRLQNRAGYFTLLLGVHEICNVLRVVLF